MINRKIAISAVSIFATFALIAGGTFAFFTDVATSANNSFAAGSLTLFLDDNNETTPAAGVTDSIQLAGLAPGVGQTGFISLHNPNVSGAINIAEVAMGANITGGNNGNGDGSNLGDVTNLTVMTGSNNTCTTNPTDHTPAMATQLGGTMPLTLSELVATDYDSLPGLNVTDTYFMCLTATVDPTAPDLYQGDSLSAEFVFTGHQNVS